MFGIALEQPRSFWYKLPLAAEYAAELGPRIVDWVRDHSGKQLVVLRTGDAFVALAVVTLQSAADIRIKVAASEDKEFACKRLLNQVAEKFAALHIPALDLSWDVVVRLREDLAVTKEILQEWLEDIGFRRLEAGDGAGGYRKDIDNGVG